MHRERRTWMPNIGGGNAHGGIESGGALPYALPRDQLEAELLRNRSSIESFIRRRSRSREDAEDLLQNVLMKSTRHFDAFRGDCPFSQWLIRIAANELKNYYRKLSNEPSSADFDFDQEFFENLQQPAGGACPYSEAEDQIVFGKLKSAIETACKPEERNIILMVYQGESFEEISGLLDLNPATVRSHFLRGRGRLLAFLVCNDPDLLGGEHAIRNAVDCACQHSDDFLDEEELAACRTQDEGSPKFRSACLKFAKHLQVPFGTLSVLGVLLWMI